MPGMKEKETIPLFKEFLHKLFKSLSLIFYSVLSLGIIFIFLKDFIPSVLNSIPLEFYRPWEWTIHELFF